MISSRHLHSLRWEDVDLRGAALRLHNSKTGPKTVPLSAANVRVLSNLTRQGDTTWVVLSQVPRGHFTSLQRVWERVRARAGLDKVRLHDPRHSFASRALALGEGLTMIGKLLGHTQVQTTARYAASIGNHGGWRLTVLSGSAAR